MRQFITISVNAFMELIRQPVFLLLLSASALFSVYLASLPYFGFGDDPKLVKDSVLAVMLLAGLLVAVLCVVLISTLTFILINFLNKQGKVQPFGEGIDWRMGQAGLLILFALWILAGLALLCSTRLEIISTLAICSAVFLLGLISDYLFSEHAKAGSWWASIAYTVLPNWQLLWVANAGRAGQRFSNGVGRP